MKCVVWYILCNKTTNWNFLTVCETCNCKKTMNRKIVIKPITATDFNERAQIDLMDFQSVPVWKFKWILNLPRPCDKICNSKNIRK